MKQLRKGMAVAAAILMVAGVAASGMAEEVPGVTKDEIKIGTFGPLTGPVSTVVDCSEDRPRVLREGAVAVAEITRIMDELHG